MPDKDLQTVEAATALDGAAEKTYGGPLTAIHRQRQIRFGSRDLDPLWPSCSGWATEPLAFLASGHSLPNHVKFEPHVIIE